MRARRFLTAAILVFSAAPTWADEAADAFNRLYAGDYDKALRTRDTAFASKLLDAAKTKGTDPGLVALLCDKAYELGSKAPGGYAWAKIAGPKPVTPVVHEGVKYLAPNNNGREGIVEARKADTGEKLWDAVIYTVKINPDLEEDVQWVFITKLELSGDKLLVTNRKGEQYALDLKTRKVEKVEKDPGKDK